MIGIYINGVQRPDVIPLAGGTLEVTANHRTDSKISVQIPIVSPTLQPADYISIYDGATPLFSGVISGCDQQDMGVSSDLDYRVYDLTMASNIDDLSTTFVDLPFSDGQTAQEILWGDDLNAPAWIVSIFRARMAPLGITRGVIEDISNVVLSGNAYLWGSYVTDVLDAICTAADCWWEITPDHVFNLRHNSTQIEAPPFLLGQSAQIYSLQASDDAYTMYSAVRVIGGKGDGAPLYAAATNIQSSFSMSGIASYATDKVVLSYPVSHLIGDNLFLWVGRGGAQYFPKVGVQGINDDDTSIEVMFSYDGTDLEAKNGFAFPDTTDQGYNGWLLSLRYIPYVPIATRLVDASLQTQLKDRRGGTGIVEYMLKDDTITDFLSAGIAGRAFLRENAKPASTVKFLTQTPGIKVGMVFAASDIPYYGISGDYRVGAVTATIIAATDDTLIWEYDVTASTVPYRDPTEALYFAPKKITLKLGDDIPAFDGVYLDNVVSITVTVVMHKLTVYMWSDFDTWGRTWDEIALGNLSWEQATALHKERSEVQYMGNYCTQAYRALIAQLINGESNVDTNALKMDMFKLGYSGGTYTPSATQSPVRQGSEIIQTYYIDDQDGQYLFTSASLFSSSDMSTPNATAQISTDKTDSNPMGAYALAIDVSISVQ